MQVRNVDVLSGTLPRGDQGRRDGGLRRRGLREGYIRPLQVTNFSALPVDLAAHMFDFSAHGGGAALTGSRDPIQNLK